ncbi:MAG: FadR family transcriptional regulator [Thiothrix sp.]|nr:FadR family transcriptional regulator [Thiothrix sp.]HPQ94175.1 FCD domain-containing protein [Thiolinea sp.]
MDKSLNGLAAPPRLKRADQIVEAVKRWIVAHQLQPGERLPNEKNLTELFACSRGTMREALKSLEVQGLITIRTGPGGGAVLAQVPYPLAAQLLRNYLHFQQLSGPDVYRLRRLVEPEIAELALAHLEAPDLVELERLTELCAQPAVNQEQRLAQRMAELDFHNLLARRCGNPLLAFIGHFLNDLIRDLVVFKKLQLPEQHEFSRSNLHFHRELIVAFRARDRMAVLRLMREHMQCAEGFNIELEGQLAQALLVGTGSEV